MVQKKNNNASSKYMTCLDRKKHTNNMTSSVTMTNKVFRQKSKCIVSWSNKSRLKHYKACWLILITVMTKNKLNILIVVVSVLNHKKCWLIA